MWSSEGRYAWRDVMFRRLIVAVAASLLAVGAGAHVARADVAGMLAGVAKREVTWMVGAAAGSGGTPQKQASADARLDPAAAAKIKQPSEGFQSRTWARALVVQGGNGGRIGYVQVDSFFLGDALQRKVSEYVDRHDTSHPSDERTHLTRDRIIIASTENHSAPQVTSTTWGAWITADVFDVRDFHYMARQIAGALIDATKALRPVRFAATVGRIDDVQRNSGGPSLADDGTPAGYPDAYDDVDLTVLRFDDVTDPAHPTPYAVLGNFGMTPSSLPGGHLLLSAEFNAMLHPATETALRARYGADAMLIWSQGNVGDSAPDGGFRAGRGDFAGRGFASSEVMARRMADHVVDTVALLDDEGNPRTRIPGRVVPFTTDARVEVVDLYVPGPVDAASPADSRPVPLAYNCRTAEAAADRGELRAGYIADCRKVALPTGPTPVAGVPETWEQTTGVPFPHNQGVVPGRTAVNETMQIHLTSARIGDVLIGTCPCGAQSDQVLNFKSRTDDVIGNTYDGFEWPCADTDDTTVTCSYPDPSKPPSLQIPRARWERVLEQVHNDARNREGPGNFSKVELGRGSVDAALYAGDGSLTGNLSLGGIEGFPVSFMISLAQDYIGYVVSYREFMAGDDHHKSLTTFGPHSADYVNTLLLRAARTLRTGESDPLLALYARPLPDPEREAEYQAFAGPHGEAVVAAYEAALPDDAPQAGLPAQQPESRARFGVTRFSWYGGSNAVDLPHVSVVDQAGKTIAVNDHGEIVTTLALPKASDAIGWAGERRYLWTAHWETAANEAVGTYRFAVTGRMRAGGATVGYEVVSDPFVVSPWASGAVIGEPEITGNRMRFSVGDAPYPDRYSDVDAADPRTPRYINSGGPNEVRYRRTFRPRPQTWRASQVTVTIVRADGSETTMPASLEGAATWGVDYVPQQGEWMRVDPANVMDAFGNPAG